MNKSLHPPGFIIYVLTLAIATPWRACAVPPSNASPTQSPPILRDELQHFSDVQHKLYPDKPLVYDQVVNFIGPKDEYTADEVKAATDPMSPSPFPYAEAQQANRDRPSKAPPDAFAAADAKRLLNDYERLHPVKAGSPHLRDALTANYGHAPWYAAKEIRDVEENSGAQKRTTPLPPADGTPLAKAYYPNLNRQKTFIEGFKSPRIRQNWRDVLYSEDPSQPDSGKQLGDLVGATFSYAHNGKNESDTWTAIGALILPWEMHYAEPDKIPAITHAAVAPSVTINRVDSNDPTTTELDTLLSRLGIYANVGFPNSADLQFRAAGVYATDTGGRASLPGGELDIEPRLAWHELLGYKHSLVTKEPLLPDESDTSSLDVQLRLWLHLEGGDVQDTGASWDTTQGSFLRLGPTVQFQVNASHILFVSGASFTALYSYLASVKGSDRHNSFLSLALVFDLLKDKSLNHKISLNLQYQRGGLDLTKQDVDSFTAGLGVLF